jgi:hypothetical protein
MVTLRKHTMLSVALGSVLALVVAGEASATHPRPGFGTPFRVPLVISFRDCTAPNAHHSPPYSLRSCAPPRQTSAILTAGNITDTSGGFAKLRVFCRAPAPPSELPPCTTTAGSNQDVSVEVEWLDARCRVGGIPGCTAAGADYTGTVMSRWGLKMTDHSNAPGAPPPPCNNTQGNPPCVTATVQSMTFSIPFRCVADGAPNGGNCRVVTTLNAVVPPGNVIKEQQRAVVAISNLKIWDAGPDGTVTPPPGGSLPCPPVCGSGDETRYLEEGIFAP